jgi:hypothetical protein
MPFKLVLLVAAEEAEGEQRRRDDTAEKESCAVMYAGEIEARA